ncbi:CocE/NonD family hydrolase [Sorangium sp. So ce327]|uniref:CocE/NonD family hydrolase n=1 Tax=Sorangium sp. So ce327 TaxID=3133301 RepID=UPI003F618448
MTEDIVASSSYLPMRDGTRLAVYVFRLATGRSSPVVWMHNRYHAGHPSTDQLRQWAAAHQWLRELASAEIAVGEISLDPWLVGLVRRGYGVVLVDARGTGASCGSRRGPFAPEEARDAAEVTAWLASRPWSSGAVGMFGRSYMGTSQYFAATEARALGAIFPEMPLFDLYDLVRPGGVFRHVFGRQWTDDVTLRDRGASVSPVQTDPEGALLEVARAEHAANLDSHDLFAPLRCRDSLDPVTGARLFLERSPSFWAADRRPATPVFLLAGWNDAFVRDALLWYHNSPGPRRLVIGPWAHTGSAGFDLLEQHAAWYDRWLAGVEPSGEEPPIYYYTVGADPGERWRCTEVWPPEEMVATPFHLRIGRSGSCRSINDGRLTLQAADSGEGADDYDVDPTTTTGTATRWANTAGGPFAYPDLASNDERALTYTTAPLTAALELTGHPIVRLWVSSTAPDVDVFAYLEEVAEDGRSLYVTEGVLRASHRALHTPPHEHLGLPYHRSYEEDLSPLPDHPVELVFDMHPISRRIAPGSRLRLAVTGADRDNALTVVPPGGARLRIHHEPGCPSRLILPVVGPSAAF